MISPGFDPLAELHQRPLVDGGVLVGAPVLLDPVAVVLVQPGQRLCRPACRAVGAGVDDDLVGRDARDRRPPRRAMMTAPESRATFSSSPVPTSGACGIEERHRLPLHVRAHERAVGVVVLEERNQRRGDRDQLLRRHVHEVDPVGRQRAGSRRPCGTAPARSANVPSGLSGALACAIVVVLLVARRRASAISSVTLPFFTTRYGVSMKPRSLIRA